MFSPTNKSSGGRKMGTRNLPQTAKLEQQLAGSGPVSFALNVEEQAFMVQFIGVNLVPGNPETGLWEPSTRMGKSEVGERPFTPRASHKVSRRCRPKENGYSRKGELTPIVKGAELDCESVPGERVSDPARFDPE
jgi:hypothetical protein